MSLKNIVKIVFFSLVCIFAASLSVFAEYTYKVPLGKSIFLRNPKINYENTYWSSSDEKIATVSQNGIAKALSKGSATIKVTSNDDIISTYQLNVIDSETIKSIFIEPNNPLVNSKIEISAITLPDIEKVKFIVNYNNIFKKFVAKTKVSDGNNFIYSTSFTVPDCEELFINTFAYKNGKWHNYKNKTKITVTKNSSNTFADLSRKRVSKDCIDFIMKCEGLTFSASKDAIAEGYVLEVGYGNNVNFGQTFYEKVTGKEAYSDFLNKINNICSVWVNSFLSANNIKFNQHQFDALTSLTYNIGYAWMNNSSLKDILLKYKNLKNISKNSANKNEFIKDYLLRHHANKKCYPGLLYRRIDELEMFLFNDYKKDGHFNKNKFELPDCIMKEYPNCIFT